MSIPSIQTILLYLAISFVAGLVIILIVRIRLRMLPPDYFVNGNQNKNHFALTVLRNIFGWGLILVGVIMWFVPGPGWASIFAGITFADFPGKKALEHKLIKYEKVFQSINSLRCKPWPWNKAHVLPPFTHPKQ